MMVNDMITTDLGGSSSSYGGSPLAGGDLHMARHDPYAKHEKGEESNLVFTQIKMIIWLWLKITHP